MSWYNPADWDTGDLTNFGSGALTGGSIGSTILPGWGTVIGAVAGGIGNAATGGKLTGSGSKGGGGPGAPGAAGGIVPRPEQYDYAHQQYANILGQAAPTIHGAQIQPWQVSQGRAGMLDVAGRLGGIASGQQRGAGEIAANAQLGRATAAQTAAARMAHGANAALAYRNAARNTADIGLAGAGMAAQARLQDQGQANTQLGQIYGSLYGQDANVASQNAQLAQAAQLANQQATMQTQAQRIQALGSMLGWDQATINAQIAQTNAAIAQQHENNNQPNFLGNLLQGAGQIAQIKGMFGDKGGGGNTSGGGS